ncbi:transposase [Streptomyces sp. NPDC059499]|uniref:transposase n=1 Tax=Streptomyces sp. NPDC059499 TaxID=3346852 RepID=UPI0036CE037C
MKGRKRFIVTDTLGLLLAVHVVAASIQDRDGAKRPLLWTRLGRPGVKKVWADQGFAGRLVGWTAQILDRDLEIVRKDPAQRGFQVQPMRGRGNAPFRGSTPTGASRGTTGPAPPIRRR